MFNQVTRRPHGAVLLGVLWLMIASLATGCANQSAQPQVTPVTTATPTTQPPGWDTLRILNPEAPTTLNPHLSRSTKDNEPSRITYEPLASFDKDGNLIPFLAAEIPSLENGGVADDGKSVTWKLRPDVRWSDGEPFTAYDVEFTYQFITNEEVGSPSKATYSTVESVEVIDDYTIKIHFEDVNPAWASPFVGLRGLIIPWHVFEPYNGANAKQAPANTLPVGTGPYRVIDPGIKPQEVLLLGTELVETNKTVFEPNPYFREADQLFFSQIEWRGGGTVDEAARLVLQDGQVDYAYQLDLLSYEELVELETGGQGRLVISFGSRVLRILLNRTDPNQGPADERSSLQFPHPFFSDEKGDKKVRQAFAHAIDRETIADLYGETGRPTTNNLVAPLEYNSSHTVDLYEYDLEQAAALLDEAGWVDTNNDGIRDKDGDKLTIVYQAGVGTIVQQTQQIVKESLESIGVEVELKIVDPTIFFGPGAAHPDSVRRFNADLQAFARRSRSPDPSSYMQLWTCSQIPQANKWAGANYERWCSKEYDELYEQSVVELDLEKRQQLFIQMNDMLIEDVAMIPVVHLAVVQGIKRDIEGVDLTPWDASTWNIQDWRRVSP